MDISHNGPIWLEIERLWSLHCNALALETTDIFYSTSPLLLPRKVNKKSNTKSICWQKEVAYLIHTVGNGGETGILFTASGIANSTSVMSLKSTILSDLLPYPKKSDT